MIMQKDTEKLLNELPLNYREVWEQYRRDEKTISNHYASHQPVLVKMLSKFIKPTVLELGIGFGSTGIINKLSGMALSIETDEDFIPIFDHFKSNKHRIIFHNDYDTYHWNCEHLNQEWDIAFVDNKPGESRQSNIMKLKDKATFIIVHDTEEAGYGYDFSSFKYQYTFNKYRPWTTVVSNFKEIPI